MCLIIFFLSGWRGRSQCIFFEWWNSSFLYVFAVMWLWAAGCGHLAVSVARKLRHFFSQLSVAFSCQPSHCHWYSHHGDRLSGLPRCYQGKQVPPVECKTSGLLFVKTPALLLFYLNDQFKIVLWATVTLPLAFGFLCACSMTSHSFAQSDVIGVLANVSLLLCALMC